MPTLHGHPEGWESPAGRCTGAWLPKDFSIWVKVGWSSQGGTDTLFLERFEGKVKGSLPTTALI